MLIFNIFVFKLKSSYHSANASKESMQKINNQFEISISYRPREASVHVFDRNPRARTSTIVNEKRSSSMNPLNINRSYSYPGSAENQNQSLKPNARNIIEIPVEVRNIVFSLQNLR